jgi:hypothetical protein
MITRYVNTASTAGGDGTTNGTAGATRAFASLGAAVRSLPNPLVDAVTIYCDGSGGADTDPPVQADFDMVTAADKYLLITTTGAARHSGVWEDANPKYRFKVTNRNGIYNNVPSHYRIDGIQGQVTVNDGGSYDGIKTSNANQTAVDLDTRASACIIKGVVTSGSLTGFQSRWPDGAALGRVVTENCLAVDCTYGFVNDFQVAIGGGPGEIYNCTAANCDFGYIDNADTWVYACLATNCGIGFVGSFYAVSDYNAEDDGNGAPGAHSLSSQTFAFVNAGAGNFALAEDDEGAIDLGPVFPQGYNSVDLAGNARLFGDAVDIGAFEYVPPAEGSTPAHFNLFLLLYGT